MRILNIKATRQEEGEINVEELNYQIIGNLRSSIRKIVHESGITKTFPHRTVKTEFCSESLQVPSIRFWDYSKQLHLPFLQVIGDQAAQYTNLYGHHPQRELPTLVLGTRWILLLFLPLLQYLGRSLFLPTFITKYLQPHIEHS